MHGIMQLAVLALATASAMAHTVDLKFIRFSQPNCEGNNHIGDDVHLHNSNCKDFKEAEAPFESFSTTEEKDEGYTSDKICEVTAYKEHNCKGQGWTMGDLKYTINECGKVHNVAGFDGRSVKVACKKRPENVSTASPSSTIPAVVTNSPTSGNSSVSVVTKTVTASSSMSTTTLTLQYQTKTCDCDL